MLNVVEKVMVSEVEIKENPFGWTVGFAKIVGKVEVAPRKETMDFVGTYIQNYKGFIPVNEEPLDFLETMYEKEWLELRTLGSLKSFWIPEPMLRFVIEEN